MNVRLRKTFAWSSAIIYEGRFLINTYEAKLDMISVSEDHREQNIAYERIKTWIYEVLNGSILISDDDCDLETWSNTNARIITVPEAPVDQVIGMLLYCKLNAVTEDRLMITDIEISSVMGEGMSYLHSQDENIGPFMLAGWWQDPRPIWTSNRKFAQNKIITLDRPPEWKDHDLEWGESHDSETDSVVFAKFSKDEEK